MAHRRRARTPYHDEAYRLHRRLRDGDLEALRSFKAWHDDRFDGWSLAEIHRAAIDKRITLESCQHAIARKHGKPSFEVLVLDYWDDWAAPIRHEVEAHLAGPPSAHEEWHSLDYESRNLLRTKVCPVLYTGARNSEVLIDGKCQGYFILHNDCPDSLRVCLAKESSATSDLGKAEDGGQYVCVNSVTQSPLSLSLCVQKLYPRVEPPSYLDGDKTMLSFPSPPARELVVLLRRKRELLLRVLGRGEPLLPYLPIRRRLARQNRSPWREFSGNCSLLLVELVVVGSSAEQFFPSATIDFFPIPGAVVSRQATDGCGLVEYVSERLMTGERLLWPGAYVDLISLNVHLVAVAMSARHEAVVPNTPRRGIRYGAVHPGIDGSVHPWESLLLACHRYVVEHSRMR